MDWGNKSIQVKAGDLVKFRNLDTSWGPTGLVTGVSITKAGNGQIYMITKAGPSCTIPWQLRNTYLEEVINESR